MQRPHPVSECAPVCTLAPSFPSVTLFGCDSHSEESNIKAGRNDPCPCGSGRKYKSCCGQLSNLPQPEAPGDRFALLVQRLEALLRTGRFTDAEVRALELLQEWPESGLLWQLLAAAVREQGKDALHALNEAARLSPDDPVARFNLGNELARRGRLAEAAACYQRVLVLEPGFARAYHSLGSVQLELGLVDEAARHCREATTLDPEFAAAHLDLGRALLRLGRDAEAAIASFCRALSIKPEFAEAHANLGNALRTIGRLDEAVAAYRRALQIEPQFLAAYTELATALRLQGRTAECEACCRIVLDRDPKSVATLAVLAELRADTGQLAEAEELFTRAVTIDPGATQSWAGLSRLRRMTAADAPWLEAVQRLLEHGPPARDEMLLQYSLGKYFDDVQDFDTAFPHYKRANELAKQCGPAHDRAALTRGMDLIIASHDPKWLGQHRPAVKNSQRPLFIVGMPRSGTTLVEQILASHPAVHGAGELNFWSRELAAAMSGASGLDPAAAAAIRPAEATLAALGERYDGLLRQLSPEAARVVDKYPTNFLSLGLIHAALPGARIIHMQRDPLDTCVSIYFQHLEAANTYANDLEDLAHYYDEYRRLMRHWRALLPPAALLEVPYEGLVQDLSGWTRRMLEWLGLPWDARCLDFHLTARSVVTASKQQVRQRIHASSVGRWRHYEKFIGPLLPLARPAQD